jgi:ribosome biogenesis GTPase / thiamine phosphate phosphatase
LQFPTLERYGWNAEIARTYEAHDGLDPGRVAVQHRGGWLVVTEDGELLADIAGRLRHEGLSPVVGDWVALRGGRIEAVLPRVSAFSRKTPWTLVAEQVLVANIDTAFLVMGLDERDFSIHRLERYLTTAWESGATPVIVLNKADLAEDLGTQVGETESVAFGVPVHVVSAATGDGIDDLHPYLDGGRTAALLGSSGVGKSTIINRLLGDERLRTGELRSDGRGRHTTTHRELIPLEGGGVIVDTPGLRELQLWESDEGLERAFADLSELAEQCRFADCRHEREPGCAVQEAIASGELPADRLESYRKLERELERLERKLNPRLRSVERRKRAAFSRSLRVRQKLEGR